MIVMYTHMGAPKSFQLYMGMYIVLSSSTKSMTLTSTDIGSPKIFSKWNQGPKGLSNFGSVRVHLFVDAPVIIMYIHMRTPRVSDSTWDVYSLVVSNQEYDPHIDQHRFPKNFSKWNRAPKGSSNFGSMRVHLFVDMPVIIMYINMKTPRVSNSMGMYVVLSSLTKSMTLTSTDIGS